MNMSEGPPPEQRRQLEEYVAVANRLHSRLMFDATQERDGDVQKHLCMEATLVREFMVKSFQRMLDGDWVNE